MLKAGIVGLPNVGKSTLFNAVTRTRKAEAANYPFCTIDPNVGIVTVPDPHLNTGKPALTLQLTPEEKAVSRLFWLMTDKPTIFACNVKENDLATADKNPFVEKVREYTKHHFACEAVVISAQIESDLIDLS